MQTCANRIWLVVLNCFEHFFHVPPFFSTVQTINQICTCDIPRKWGPQCLSPAGCRYRRGQRGRQAGHQWTGSTIKMHGIFEYIWVILSLALTDPRVLKIHKKNTKTMYWISFCRGTFKHHTKYAPAAGSNSIDETFGHYNLPQLPSSFLKWLSGGGRVCDSQEASSQVPWLWIVWKLLVDLFLLLVVVVNWAKCIKMS